jgi:tRNA-modifying protein YgfZ
VVAQTSQRIVRRPRAFIGVSGSDAADYLQRMVSNDVEALGIGEACDALLLTPKARIIAPLRVLRRGEDDFLLSTEPELGERVVAELTRMRFAARCEIAPEEHDAWVVLGGDEVIDERPEGDEVSVGEAERARIEAGIPSWGAELDDTILPAEAGLDETHISFTKGCYPGQEPVARQHHRGKVNRRLRVLDVEGDATRPETPVVHGEKEVGRVTSSVAGLALAYVRVEVPEDAALDVGGRPARLRSRAATLAVPRRP